MIHPERLRARRLLFWLLVLTATVALAVGPVAASDTDTHGGSTDDHGPGLGAELALWTCLPFVGILLSIALFPLVAPKFWHHHFPEASAFWALAFSIPFLIVYRGEALHEILHVYIIDYIPFIILLWALFTVSGGIYIRGTIKGSPAMNTVMLAIGTVLASWIGTTGASMVLIRPVLRANAWRRRKVHIIVFFIFLVSNIGGALTPLGDPPLFLGFLHGVPFFWTLNLFLPLLLVAIPLLAIFFVVDTLYSRREKKPESTKSEPLKIEGLHNLIFLAGIVGSVLLSGMWNIGTVHILGIEQKIQFLLRDVFMIAMGVLSLWSTRREIHQANDFSWFPIKEVAILFAGIFMTIIPALAILKAGSQGVLAGTMEALSAPVHYYWVTGSLSSFLDNAPTYLTFFNTILGKFHAGTAEAEAVAMLIKNNETYLLAISTGAVFFGAVTYIGNAPNFMVKSIAEEAGIPMPSFFGYMLKYSLIILIPLFFIISIVFFKWW